MEDHIRVKQTLSWAIGIALAIIWLAICLTLVALIPMPSEAATESESADQQPAVRLTCHTVTAATYNRQVRKLDRIERLNPTDLRDRKHRRATRKVCKHRQYKRVKDRIKLVCKPRHIVTGRVSYFSDGTTASGADASETPGLAINPSPGTDAWGSAKVRYWMRTGAVMKVKLLGRVAYTRLVDLGPAGWVNRAIDFTAPLARQMGFLPNFPTDKTGTVWRYLIGCR